MPHIASITMINASNIHVLGVTISLKKYADIIITTEAIHVLIIGLYISQTEIPIICAGLKTRNVRARTATIIDLVPATMKIFVIGS